MVGPTFPWPGGQFCPGIRQLDFGCHRVNDNNNYGLLGAFNMSILRELSQSLDKIFCFSKPGVLL